MMFIFSRLLLALLTIISVVSADDNKKKMAFSVEKGVKCHGGGDMSEMRKDCEGGMKMEFSATCKPMDMIYEIAEGIHDHLQHNFIPDVEDLYPSDDVMQEMMAQEMMAIALAGEDEEGVGMSKTIEFGGMAQMEWGCKVKYEYKKGKFTKTADCGFKGKASAGKNLDKGRVKADKNPAKGRVKSEKKTDKGRVNADKNTTEVRESVDPKPEE